MVSIYGNLPLLYRSTCKRFMFYDAWITKHFQKILYMPVDQVIHVQIFGKVHNTNVF